jgi:putative endopeptidase
VRSAVGALIPARIFRTSGSTNTYVYDAENRLVSRSGGVSLAYDPNGRLWQLSAPTGTTRFEYDGDKLLEEFNTSGNWVRLYAWGPNVDEPLVWYEGTGGPMRRFLHADHQGSTTAVPACRPSNRASQKARAGIWRGHQSIGWGFSSMIKKIVMSSVATLGLVAVMAPAWSAVHHTARHAVHRAPARAHAAVAAKPQLGAWGVDLAGMDKSVNPGDSWYDYVNGTWDKNTQIPPDKASWGGFGILRDLSDQRTHDLIEAIAKSHPAPGTNEQKVADLYNAFMDEQAIEAKGTAPLKPYLERIAAIRTRTDLAAAFAEANRTGVGGPIRGGIQQDAKNNSVYAVFLGQGGIGLPDRDYYLDAKFADVRTKYVQHVANMLRLAGIDDSDARAQRIFDLEKQIAQTHWTRVESRQTEKRYNPMTLEQLAALAPGLDWNTYLQGTGLAGQNRVIVAQPSAIAGEAKLIAEAPIETWKDYLTFHTISSAAQFLPRAFVDENFAFYGKTLSGTPQLKDRWKRGVDLVNGALGEAVGEAYVARYFTPETKAKADELVHNLIRAMDARLARLTWMAPETKAKARAKLAAFTPKIGYPTKWRDYSALTIVPGDLVGDAFRVSAFEYNRQLAKMGKPVDRTEWFMTPMTVNAYANPTMNEVVFPAAILQPPFFDPNADMAVNYGAIGAVIGHELSHHFDDQGRKYDPQGNLADWWTPEDVARFKVGTDKVVAQYGGYEPLPGQHVNGELTLGENMADLAGLNIAYDAYKLSLHGKPDKVIGGYTGDQRFFLGFGQVWRNKMREAALVQQLTTDPHSPGQLRPNVVRNFDAWYKAFNVRDGKIYLPPEQRIHIW